MFSAIRVDKLNHDKVTKRNITGNYIDYFHSLLFLLLSLLKQGISCLSPPPSLKTFKGSDAELYQSTDHYLPTFIFLTPSQTTNFRLIRTE